jgi:hypothetical protein
MNGRDGHGRSFKTIACCGWNGGVYSFIVYCWIKWVEKSKVVLYNKDNLGEGERDVNGLS